MKIEDLLTGRLKNVDVTHPDARLLLLELLECRAKLKDNDINTLLLYELIGKYVSAEKKLKSLNRELLARKKLIDADLAAAAEIQKSLLPRKRISTNLVETAWKFMPCEKIGGDIFDVRRQGPERLAAYMLDVSGHGVPAAMITVCASQYIDTCLFSDRETDPAQFPVDPALSPSKILASLDAEFPFSRFENFFTIAFMVVDLKNRFVIHGAAGHPPPVILRSGGRLEILETTGPAIGAGEFASGSAPGALFSEQTSGFQPGDKLLLYTDGIVEYENGKGEFYGNGRFLEKLRELAESPVSRIVDESIRSLLAFGDNAPPGDDVSLLAIEFKDG